MCDPATAAVVGLGIQGAGVLNNYLSDKSASKAYTQYQQLSTQSSVDNFRQQNRQINNRYSQEQEAMALELQQMQLQNMQAKATAQASAASGGAYGNTIEGLFRGYDRAAALNNYVSEKNLRMKGLQYSDELDSLRAQAISAINLQQPYTSQGASILLGGLGNIMTSYAQNDYRQRYLERGR